MIDINNQNKTFFIGHRDVLICLFLIIATFAVYSQVVNHEFVNYDDNVYVTSNRYVQNGLTLESITWAFTATHAGNWHPLTWLSHMLDCQLYGMRPGLHHLTSVLLHLANTLLLFLVLKKMTGALWRSGLVAALFGLHPLHVESVAWVAERKDVLSTFFWMLTMRSYVWYVEKPGTNRYLLVLLFFILGLMSKPMLVTLPFALLLLDYWPLNRIRFGQTGEGSNSQQRPFVFYLVREKIPFFILTAASCAVTLLVQQKVGAVVPLTLYSLNVRIANAIVSFAAYIGKMIWPFHLAVLYPHHGMPPLWQIVGACLLLLSMFFLIISAKRQRPYFTFGWMWYMLTLVPVIGLVQVGSQAMADRYTYVPLIGIFVIFVWGVPELAQKRRYWKAGLAAITAVTLSIFMVTTWIQVRSWSSSLTLFEHAVEVSANNCISHNNLGLALTEQGRIAEAIKHYTESLRLNPDFENAHNNMGIALAEQGKTTEAIRHYTEAIRLNPDYEPAHSNLGNALFHEGKIEKAYDHFKEVLRINPDSVKTYINLGHTLSMMGRIAEAIKHYTKALRLNPDYAAAHNYLGLALAKQGRIAEGISHFKDAVRLEPDYAIAHNNMGIALAKQGRIAEANKHYTEAIRLNPDYMKAHINLGDMLAGQGS